MRRSDLVQHKEKERAKTRTSAKSSSANASIFLRVLIHLRHRPADRSCPAGAPVAPLKSLFTRAPRTEPYQYGMGRKDRLVLSADAKPEMLEKLVKQAPENRLLPLRLISEHPPPMARLSANWQNTRTCRFVKTFPPSECDADDAHLLEQRPQPAALVSCCVQSEHADAAPAPFAHRLKRLGEDQISR